MKAFNSFSINSFSIKTKLNLIILIISSITLLIASTIFSLYDREEFKAAMKNELSILGDIIGDRSTAALLFNDEEMVIKNMSSLKAKPTIINALIFKSDGTFFAKYNRQNDINIKALSSQVSSSQQEVIFKFNSALVKKDQDEIKQYKFSAQFLEVWEPITQSDEIVGLIYLKSDLSELNARLNYFIKTILTVYFLSLFIAFLMAIQLQKIITDPISNLVKITSLISQKKDYSIRASSQTDDELGQLINHFNEMLEQIQSKDIALQEINSHLEQRVEERTLELTKSNTQLIKAKELADIASRAKSEFLANMSHEIRTPMNGVLTTAELMISEEMSNKSRHYLKIITTSAVSLLGIINDILDFSKIEAGKLAIENIHFRTSHLFDRLADIFINKFTEKKLELLFDIDPETPENLFGDAMRIQQILINLIANSLKFTQENGTVICGIKVINRNSERVQLTFFVRDSGIGIEPSKIDSLFSAFTQADSTTTRKYGGTGLGLTICKSLVELMGGTIQVDSEYDKGSYFYFDLDIAIDLKETEKQNNEVFSLPAGMENINVLVVDDQEDSLFITRNIIESFGFNATLSSSGKEAFDFLKNNPDNNINLLLLDWRMPDLDGLETSRLIRQELDFKKPIILMSAFERDDSLKAASKDSINVFLQKPLRPSVLFNTIMHLYNDESFSNYNQTDNKQLINAKQLIYAEHLHGNRLLIAEDNIINQQVILAVFDKIDVSIKLVNNGKEAIEAIQQYAFDAVLMDMQMPVMDGYEATRAIRAIPEFASMPIIALTAHAMEGDEERCLHAGSNAYVTKPINQEQLFKVLARFLHPKKTFENDLGDDSVKKAEFADSEHFTQALNEDCELLDTIPGINIYEAIKQLNIEKAQFKKILVQFFSHNEETINIMSEFVENKQWQSLRDMAHDLKGSGANIGAYNLQKKAYQLELSCKKPVNTEQLKKYFDEFSSALQQVLVSINTLVASHSIVSNTIVSKKKSIINKTPEISVNKNKLEETIIELNEALISGKPIEIKELLMLLMAQIVHPQLNELETQINNFDFEEAIETLTSIRNDVNKLA